MRFFKYFFPWDKPLSMLYITLYMCISSSQTSLMHYFYREIPISNPYTFCMVSSPIAQREYIKYLTLCWVLESQAQ